MDATCGGEFEKREQNSVVLQNQDGDCLVVFRHSIPGRCG